MAKTLCPSSVTVKIHRFAPELVTPAKPTPHEFKPLSDLDNSLRFQLPTISIYPYNPSVDGVDLVKLLKNAISQALIYYYPLAGRLRETPSGKLIVECTGEGVMFIEADADVTLDQFGYPLAPPFLCCDLYAFGVLGSSGIVNSPLIVIQMTRLKCGGIIIGTRFNHCMCDGLGYIQFMSAVAEIAKGATSPSVPPTWERHIFDTNSNNPQRWRLVPDSISEDESGDIDLCHHTFLFGQTEISGLRKHIFHDFKGCSCFEMLVTCVWKCRVLALSSHSSKEESTSLIWPINLRENPSHIKVPPGYYGNGLAYAVVKSTVGEIIRNPLTHIFELVRNGKDIVPEDPNRSFLSLVANMEKFTVTDIRNSGHGDIDYGWGKPEYGGFTFSLPNIYCVMSFNGRNGEKGIMVPICLPTKPMEVFEKELNNILEALPLSGADYNVAKSKL